jgi:DNA-binding beta-propeller fold protein YncE/mono/diheme cytochrome c family protein
MKITILSLALCLLAGCSSETLFAPDNIYLTADQSALLITNRAAKTLVHVTPDGQTIANSTPFPTPINDLIQTDDNRIWAISDGANASLYELNATSLQPISATAMGHTPSAITLNPRTNTLWIAQRFNNELWEVDSRTKAITHKVAVSREPVDLALFANDSLLLVANNLPAMAATSYPVASQLDIIDTHTKQIATTILLPNGATDVKSIATDKARNYAYVTHLISRYQLPTNQVDRGWMTTNALSIIDLNSQTLLTSVLLDTPQKGAANPWSIQLSADDNTLWIALAGSHELCAIDRHALHSRINRVRRGEAVTPSTKAWEEIPNDAGFLHGIQTFIPTQGKSPRALAIGTNTIYTANYFTGELVTYHPEAARVVKSPLGSPLTTTQQGMGEMYFHDATLCYQQWQTCASCHPNDARVDGLNWDLLNDGIGNLKNTKTMLLAHQTPPSMATGIRKDASTAVRSGIQYILFAQADASTPKAIDAYLSALTPVPSPYLEDGKLSEAAQKGEKLFNTHCASCHNGAHYTDMKQYTIAWATGSEKDKKMDVPALTEVWRTAPYLYDGRCYTMRALLEVHGAKTKLSTAELDNLATYVLSL